MALTGTVPELTNYLTDEERETPSHATTLPGLTKKQL